MQRSFAILVLSLIVCAPSFAQSSTDDLTPQKREDIKKLMVITGSAKIAGQFMDSFMQSFSNALKASQPDVPDRLFTIAAKEVNALLLEKMEEPGGLIDLTTPIYGKYLTHSEIKGLLAFYESDLGRKVIQVLPKVTSEAMAAGQAWGQSLGPDIIKRIQVALKKEGIELPEK